MSFTEDYEFEVTKEESYSDEGLPAGYSVSLPHQCDGWEIVGAEIEAENQSIPHNGRYPALPASKELAINQMELFIKRANEALEKLKALD
jgi:hypothetical protein